MCVTRSHPLSHPKRVTRRNESLTLINQIEYSELESNTKTARFFRAVFATPRCVRCRRCLFPLHVFVGDVCALFQELHGVR
jgi:Pyruvate/2-oxoacid:ferredoxin oxidoreductase delta subunit